MNFDNAKENIQPLACGRDAKCLEIAISAEFNEEAQKELVRQKGEYEEKIQTYCGDDPLETWFEYITWVEQCYVKSGKECSIDELLKKCLLQFGDSSKYFQDSRFIKIYIKFIDTQENPIEIYQQLYNHGIGTMVADFYIAWAYYYDLMDNFNKANEIFIKGLEARAQPLEELEQAQKTFSLSIPARLINRDEENKQKFHSTMEEKRQALTSLRAHKHKHVGSLRTGNVIKSSKPGRLTSSSSSTPHSQTSKCIDNRRVNIFNDASTKFEDSIHYISSQTDISITHSLVDKARHKENKKEPGPWTKSNKNQNNVIQTSTGSLAFEIMEDSENKAIEKLGEEFSIRIPSNFKRSNLPQSQYKVHLCISEARAFSLPKYDKIMIYPGNGDEYSIEELRAWRYFKKMNVENQFVLKYDKFWTNEGLNLKPRIPPFFPSKNQNQSELLTEEQPKELPYNQRIHISCWKNCDYNEDLTIEDLLAKKWFELLHKNKTCVMNISLDETVICEANDDSIVMIDDTNILNEVETPTPSPAAKKMKVSLDVSTKSRIEENTSTDPKPAFEIFTDELISIKHEENIPPSVLPIHIEPATKESNFQIFEDDKDVVFKEPQYTGTIKKSSIRKPQPIKVTHLVEKPNENDLVGFSTEETFSTQNFVMFIKQQETSTPVQKKISESNIPVLKEVVKMPTLSKQPVKIMATESMSESEVAPKQLSVIMETSETNTGGTSTNGTNTKSSVEGNESSKFLLNCNHTGKSRTINSGQNLSTIHENLCVRDPSMKNPLNYTTLGMSGLKLTDDSVNLPKSCSAKNTRCEDEKLYDLFSKTPDSDVKVGHQYNTSPLKSVHISSKLNNQNGSEDELLDFFKKSPKSHKKLTYIPDAPIVLNESVTIPSFKEILLNNKCDNTATNVNADIVGASMAMPASQSIMPEFTENISIFAQHQKSKLISFTTTKSSEDKTEHLVKYPMKMCEPDQCFEGDLGKSIYEPREYINDKDNIDEVESANEPTFQHKIIDLNQTRQQIDNCVSAENIDPWNVDLCNAFLEDLDFFNYLEKRNDCVLINNVPPLKGKKKIEIAGKLFESIEYISKGAYGYIYRSKNVAAGKIVVLKQERPPNCWEYYISIIITERIIMEFLPRFMIIDYALIGNNSSILISDYVCCGTLLDVCNKIYKATARQLDELIVIILAIELFTIVDLLHSADIIHGDIKPDNFLLTSSLSLDTNRPILKLIDYGNSIDMQRFRPNTTFRTQIKTEDFICSEMKDGRPWTYQTDLFCLAGTIHVLLFGHYMKTENKSGKINILTKLPRYFHKAVWERIFTSLLNVPDCHTFPNLQDFKLDLKQILSDKEKVVLNKLSSFNRIIM